MLFVPRWAPAAAAHCFFSLGIGTAHLRPIFVVGVRHACGMGRASLSRVAKLPLRMLRRATEVAVVVPNYEVEPLSGGYVVGPVALSPPMNHCAA